MQLNYIGARSGFGGHQSFFLDEEVEKSGYVQRSLRMNNKRLPWPGALVFQNVILPLPSPWTSSVTCVCVCGCVCVCCVSAQLIPGPGLSLHHKYVPTKCPARLLWVPFAQDFPQLEKAQEKDKERGMTRMRVEAAQKLSHFCLFLSCLGYFIPHTAHSHTCGLQTLHPPWQEDPGRANLSTTPGTWGAERD